MSLSLSDQDIYLTSDEAAKLLRLSTRTLERMRVTGDGPRFMKAGTGKRSRVLYKTSDISEWLENNAYHSTSEY
ncbi:MAG: helix-turn-helix domain-containing protein [Pseudomonadota bacterium]